MASPPPNPQELVRRLDARHEELIRRLDELNDQIEQALAEFATARDAPAGNAVGRRVA